MSRRWPTYLRLSMLVNDEFLPIFDVSDELAVAAEADVASAWTALTAVDWSKSVDGIRSSPCLGRHPGARGDRARGSWEGPGDR